MAPMRHLAAFLFLVATACGGDGVEAEVPLYGGGCATDADCEDDGVCREVGGLPGLCTVECDSRTDCYVAGLAECRPEGVCIALCQTDDDCLDGTACLWGPSSMGYGSCYPEPPR